MRNVILPWAVGEIDLGDDVLEVGPGYGATTDVLCEKVGHITSVEIDEQLASMLTERFAQADNVEIVHGDGTALPYPDDRFTGAACFTMLHHVPTTELQDRLFAEVARVLKPGAALVASDSLGSDELKAHHEDDTYNPVDPTRSTVACAAGFAQVEVRTNPYGWAAVARSSVLRGEDLGLADLPPVLALAAVLIHDALAEIDVLEEAGASALGAARGLSPDHLRRGRRGLLDRLSRCCRRLVLLEPGHHFLPQLVLLLRPLHPLSPTVPTSAGLRAHSGQSTSDREPQRYRPRSRTLVRSVRSLPSCGTDTMTSGELDSSPRCSASRAAVRE